MPSYIHVDGPTGLKTFLDIDRVLRMSDNSLPTVIRGIVTPDVDDYAISCSIITPVDATKQLYVSLQVTQLFNDTIVQDVDGNRSEPAVIDCDGGTHTVPYGVYDTPPSWLGSDGRILFAGSGLYSIGVYIDCVLNGA